MKIEPIIQEKPNQFIPVCFYCGVPKLRIVPFHLREATPAVQDFDPCVECDKKWFVDDDNLAVIRCVPKNPPDGIYLIIDRQFFIRLTGQAIEGSKFIFAEPARFQILYDLLRNGPNGVQVADKNNINPQKENG